MKVYVKSDYLKKEILKSGNSISSFAKLIPVSKSYLYSVVKEGSTVSPSLAKSIADLLECDISELFFVGSEEEYLTKK